MNHRLTDEMCEELSGEPLSELAEHRAEWIRQDMRAAADWQLEQVIKWLSENLGIIDNHPRWGMIPRYLKNTCDDECAVVDEWKVISDLRKAMRPQEDS